MSLVESIKEASSSTSYDSLKISLDGNALAQSIFKLEMSLSKEIKENLAEASDKMMKEFRTVEKNFEEMFDRMDQQEEATEKLRLKFIQYEARFEKFERDQDNLNKRINGLIAAGPPKTHSFVPNVNPHLRPSRARAPFNANMVCSQQQQTQHQHPRNRTFVSKFVKDDVPEEKPQFSSNDQKSWTLRGEGMFTESNSSSEDEYAGKLVAESPISAKLSDCVTTALGSVSKNSVNSGDVASDAKSRESEKVTQKNEVSFEKIDDVLADAMKSMLKPRVRNGSVVDALKVVEAEVAVEKMCFSEPFEEEKEAAISCAIIVKEEISLSVPSEKRESLSPAADSPTMCPDVAEALAKMTATSKLSAQSSTTAAKGTASGGFGSFRRGKPTNGAPIIPKPAVKVAKVSAGTHIRTPESAVGEIVSRPLTPDEMDVLNKVFQKKESPKTGTFFGKGCGAMIQPGGPDRRSPAQFLSSPSFSSPRNPKGVGASFGNNWRKQQPAKKFGL